MWTVSSATASVWHNVCPLWSQSMHTFPQRFCLHCSEAHVQIIAAAANVVLIEPQPHLFRICHRYRQQMRCSLSRHATMSNLAIASTKCLVGGGRSTTVGNDKTAQCCHDGNVLWKCLARQSMCCFMLVDQLFHRSECLACYIFGSNGNRIQFSMNCNLFANVLEEEEEVRPLVLLSYKNNCHHHSRRSICSKNDHHQTHIIICCHRWTSFHRTE